MGRKAGREGGRDPCVIPREELPLNVPQSKLQFSEGQATCLVGLAGLKDLLSSKEASASMITSPVDWGKLSR